MWIRLNLYEVLRQLILDGEHHWLWIDAICINQKDLEEKSSQISMMADIYRSAQEVHTWLGPMDVDMYDTLELMDIMEPFFQQAVNKTPETSDIAGHDPLDASYIRNLGFDPNNFQRLKSKWFSFIQFLHRSWFWRRWTFQEMALPKLFSMWCGVEKIALSRLRFLHTYLFVSNWKLHFRSLDRGYYLPKANLWFHSLSAVNYHRSSAFCRADMESEFRQVYGITAQV